MRNCRRDNSNSHQSPNIRSVGNRCLRNDGACNAEEGGEILVLDGGGELLCDVDLDEACAVLNASSWQVCCVHLCRVRLALQDLLAQKRNMR